MNNKWNDIVDDLQKYSDELDQLACCDDPYELSDCHGIKYSVGENKCIGESSNVRKRPVRAEYLEKLAACGKRFDDALRLEELLKNNPSRRISMETRTYLIKLFAFTVIPSAFLAFIYFFGVAKTATIICAIIWLLFGSTLMCVKIKSAIKKSKLYIKYIDDVRNGSFEAYEFVITDKNQNYERQGSLNRSNYVEFFYYLFTSSGMNFRIEDSQMFNSAEIGNKLIILCCKSGDTTALIPLID